MCWVIKGTLVQVIKGFRASITPWCSFCCSSSFSNEGFLRWTTDHEEPLIALNSFFFFFVGPQNLTNFTYKDSENKKLNLTNEAQ